jgi:hypothetical protein
MTDTAEPAAAGNPPTLPEAGASVPVPVASPASRRWLDDVWLFRAEDLLLAVWIAIAAPLVVRVGGIGVFDENRPVEGVVILSSLAAALYCLIAGTSSQDGSADRPVRGSVIGAGVGPLAGGVILVAATGFSALSAPDGWTAPIAVAGLVAIGLVRLRVPAIPAAARRAMLTPFVLVSGSLFWALMNAVLGPGGASGVTASQLRDALVNQAPGAGPFALALLAFSAVYYAMLVFAPRHVADGEGNPVAWLVRYGLFVASMLLGWGWVNAFGL